MNKKITISSSIKFYDLIKTTINKLSYLGYTPLFPNLEYSSESKDNILTSSEKIKLAREHYAAIKEADAVYFILPKGYMGTSCKLELGYALALNKPIYFSEPTKDTSLDGYSKKIISLENLLEFDNEFN